MYGQVFKCRSVVELDINCAIATSLMLGKLGTYIIDCSRLRLKTFKPSMEPL